MQFEYDHKKIGTDYATVTFTGHLYRLPAKAHNSLMNVLEKLGGIVNHEVNSCEFKFPSFVSSTVIAQVIHNTCFECGGLMGDTWASDNVNSIHIRKCTVCGHSHT